MTTARFIDLAACLLATVAPIILVWRWRLIGVMIGTIFAWATLAVVGPILSALDRQREGAMLDAIWLLFGSTACIGYCLLIHVALTTIRRISKSRTSPRVQS